MINAKRLRGLKKLTDVKGISIKDKFRQYCVRDNVIFGYFFYLIFFNFFKGGKGCAEHLLKKNAKIIKKRYEDRQKHTFCRIKNDFINISLHISYSSKILQFFLLLLYKLIFCSKFFFYFIMFRKSIQIHI